MESKIRSSSKKSTVNLSYGFNYIDRKAIASRMIDLFEKIRWYSHPVKNRNFYGRRAFITVKTSRNFMMEGGMADSRSSASQPGILYNKTNQTA